MENDYLKELLTTNRNDKIILTYYLIASLGGTIGLIFRFIYITQGQLELFFIVLGILSSSILIYCVSNISEEIIKTLNSLKK